MAAGHAQAITALRLQRYAEHLSRHFAQAASSRSVSWLQAQDNASWDPRPASPATEG